MRCALCNNLAHAFGIGEPEKVAEVFAKAAHVTRLKFEGKRFTLTCQGPGVFARKRTSSPTSSA